MKVNLLQGRFQPFTLGHMKCVEAAAEKGLPTVIAQIETTVSDRKHPFTDKDLKKPMEDLIKSSHDIIDIIKVKNADIIKISEAFAERGYEIASWTCGTDRIAQYSKMTKRYHDDANLTSDFQMIEIPRTDEDISATAVRNAIKADDRFAFKKLTPPCIHNYYDLFSMILKRVYSVEEDLSKDITLVRLTDVLKEALQNRSVGGFIRRVSGSLRDDLLLRRKGIKNLEDIAEFINDYRHIFISLSLFLKNPAARVFLLGLLSSSQALTQIIAKLEDPKNHRVFKTIFNEYKDSLNKLIREVEVVKKNSKKSTDSKNTIREDRLVKDEIRVKHTIKRDIEKYISKPSQVLLLGPNSIQDISSYFSDGRLEYKEILELYDKILTTGIVDVKHVQVITVNDVYIILPISIAISNNVKWYKDLFKVLEELSVTFEHVSDCFDKCSRVVS